MIQDWMTFPKKARSLQHPNIEHFLKNTWPASDPVAWDRLQLLWTSFQRREAKLFSNLSESSGLKGSAENRALISSSPKNVNPMGLEAEKKFQWASWAGKTLFFGGAIEWCFWLRRGMAESESPGLSRCYEWQSRRKWDSFEFFSWRHPQHLTSRQ